MRKPMGKKFMRCAAAILLSVTTLFSLTGCGAGKDSSEGETLNIAYQYGLAYAPAILVQHGKLIEQAYEEATGEQVKVTWTQMSSGADINVAIASGSIDMGFMGIAPAVSGIMNAIDYKIFTGLSGQEHGIMSNAAEISSLADLVASDKQIALVNLGSIQHIILARALKHAGYEAHALDSHIVGMKHPDGMTALQSGSVACHLTSNPYIYKERNDSSLHEVSGISEVWTKENSFIVGIASGSLYKNEKLYDAVCDAFADAIGDINSDPTAAAKITCEYNGNTPEDEEMYMKAGVYSTETVGIYELAVFMAEEGFIDKVPENYEALVYDNVKGN